MTPPRRTPQLRDRRFARVRRLTQTAFVGSGAVAAVLAGFVAANPHTTTTSIVTPTTSAGSSTTTAQTATHTATKATTPVTPAPVTTTTVCTSTPSGTVTCY
jgi:hypothetical protein